MTPAAYLPLVSGSSPAAHGPGFGPRLSYKLHETLSHGLCFEPSQLYIVNPPLTRVKLACDYCSFVYSARAAPSSQAFRVGGSFGINGRSRAILMGAKRIGSLKPAITITCTPLKMLRGKSAALMFTALLYLCAVSEGSNNVIPGRFRARLASPRHIDHHISAARHGGVAFRSALGSTASRDLLQTAQAPLCVFDGGYCLLNAAYPTTLGPPRTDTQKCVRGCLRRQALPRSLHTAPPY